MSLAGYIFGLPNEKAGYGYINVPKAACSSIKTAIAEHLGADATQCHLASAMYTRRVDYIHRHRELLWFTVVRHPCDRLVSLWADALAPPYPSDILSINGDLSRMVGLPFNEFVDLVIHRDPAMADPHFAPQVSLLRYGGRLLPDEIYRFETLVRDWKVLQECFGLPELPHERRTEHPPWQEMFMPGQAKAVARWYWRDFEAFGYEVKQCECA